MVREVMRKVTIAFKGEGDLSLGECTVHLNPNTAIITPVGHIPFQDSLEEMLPGDVKEFTPEMPRPICAEYGYQEYMVLPRADSFPSRNRCLQTEGEWKREVESSFNEVGKEGWKLCYVDEDGLLFRRTKQERIYGLSANEWESKARMLMEQWEIEGTERGKYIHKDDKLASRILLNCMRDLKAIFFEEKEKESEPICSTPYSGQNIDREIVGERRMGELVRGVLEDTIKSWLSEAARRGKMGDGSNDAVATTLNQCAEELKEKFNL